MSRSSAVIVALATVLLWGEAVHWRSASRRLGRRPRPGPHEAVVVLGYRNRGERANFVNRYRVRAAVRSQHPQRNSVLVLTGGAVGGQLPEAELMAKYARDELQYGGELRTETCSRSTWENIQNVIPLIEHADHLKIVSSSLHAEKGRAYLWKLRPDLGERLVRSDEYRFGELILLKPLMSLIGLRNLARLQPAEYI